MISLARLSIRRPKTSLAVWLVTAGILAVIGFGVAKTVSPSVTVVPGTQSSRAQQLANAEFGPTQLVPILLEGPKSQLDRQGPRLVIALTKRAHTRVLSAWDAGTASAGLRPRPTAAMIVVSVDRSEKDVVQYDQPQIERLVSRQITAPVKSFITGQPSLDRAVKDASISNLRQTELIAVGILFLLLLVGLRAPVAALVVTAVGAISMLAGFGDVALLGHFLHLDPVGVALGTMTGLALGVGFSLLIIDRFHREELPPGLPARSAVSAAVSELQTTGKAVLVSGTALIVALALVAVIGPTELLVSLGTGMLTCAAFATGGAVVVMPAALVLLGRGIDKFSFPAPTVLTRAWSRLLDGGNWITRHAVYAGFAATALLAAIAVPALSLNSGPPDISQLPAHAKARIAFQEVGRVMGPGWATPYNMIVVAQDRPITDPKLLANVEALQTRIARDNAVNSVTGPGAINANANQLKKFWPAIQHSAKLSKQSKKDLLKLINGLGQAGAGSAQLQAGLRQAASGAGRAHSGSGQLQSGSERLRAGLLKAKSGSSQLSGGLNKALAGAQELKVNEYKALSGAQALATGAKRAKAGSDLALSGAQQLRGGAGQALAGSAQLANGLRQAAGPVKAGIPQVEQLAISAAATNTAIGSLKPQAAATESATSNALAALRAMTSGTSDPKYAQALDALATAQRSAGAVTSGLVGASRDAALSALIAGGVTSQIKNQLSPGLDQLAAGASKLEGGLQQLRNGNAQLAVGLSKLASGNGQLANGMGKLATGTGQLAAGSGQLSSGMGKLANGGGQLDSGLAQLSNGAGQLRDGLSQLTSGTGQLAAGLAGAVGPTGQLVTGLGTMQAGVIKARGQIPSTKDLERLQRQSPGLFSSGYFVLAAVAGAVPADRNASTFTINTFQGGNAAQIMIVSNYKASDPRSVALGSRLADIGRTFGKQNHVQVAIGGPAGNLGDLTSVTKSRLWPDVIVISLALTLVLALALRTVLLPAVATMFSLLTTAASFGVLQLLFGGSDPPLGGPGWLDPMSIIGIFAVVFGISTTFATLVLMRTREALVRSASTRDAICVGLRQTAAATTGAGLVMAAALIPFANTDLINVRQFGIGVAIAILLEVVLVRPVLLPAAEAVLGRLGWWPTQGAGPDVPRRPRDTTRRLPIPHRRPRIAHH